ncbi:MAG TPA: cobyric acid synthase [Dehalococcoidia bacterium]|nr:cobyric acid synthase [Dehalococcoidia bacterium]
MATRAKTLMVQGTASSVGKSVLVAALCRILKQDGLRVAPFKSQNMALNSFVTAEGGEMGRAQVVQAMAAGVEPSVDMNPILLKPEADARSQVIVRGKVYGTLPARDYYQERLRLLSIIEESLERLRASYDVVLIEGAGSPAEVNLKQNEIVNMRIARMAQAPVLLAGDIDRGGVFAALVGTLELLEPEERAFVRGFVINKFRGDVSLLKPGLDFLEARTGVPVVGVVPYFTDIQISEEDSVSLEQGRPVQDGVKLIDIAVIQFPRISNFDDFDPLAQEEGVGVRYVRDAAALGGPDLVILPGTKSTMSDLGFLRRSGLAEAVIRLARKGTPVIGVCGGYQMLGQTIHDPQGVESSQPCVAGLGLLPVSTTFEREKATHQVTARVADSTGMLAGATGKEVRGYEIHMGSTSGQGEAAPFVVLERSGERACLPDGCIDASGHILGTYIHGLFSNTSLRLSLLGYLAEKKGISLPRLGAIATQEEHLNRLAALVRGHVDMGLIYRITGL